MLNLRDTFSVSNPLRRAFRQLQAVQRVSRAKGRVGLPGAAIYFPLGGLGDDLLTTALVQPLHQATGKPLWVLSKHSDIFAGLRDIAAVLPPTDETAQRLEALGVPVVRPTYTTNLDGGSRHASPREHILVSMARMAALKGKVTLRPQMKLQPDETAGADFAQGAIVFQSSGLSARFPIPNKEWLPERFAEVAAHFCSNHTVLQIGSTSDPLLPRAIDLRGRTTLRQMAAILSRARLFVGLVGFPMHVARAVECPAVIVYGGREAPWQSGYTANLNIHNPLACAPCWLVDKCDYNHACMREITTGQVITAVEDMLARNRAPLPAEVAQLDP